MLRGICQYSCETYEHTARMMSVGFMFIEDYFESIVQAIEEHTPLRKESKNGSSSSSLLPTKKELKTVLFGAIVVHDLGKTKINTEIIHKPSNLSVSERREVEKHPMWTVDLMIPKIVAIVEPYVDISLSIKENRLCRESNNELRYLLHEVDRISALGEVNEITDRIIEGMKSGNDTESLFEELKKIVDIVIVYNWRWKELNKEIENMEEAVEIGDPDLVSKRKGAIIKVVDQILKEEVEIKQSISTISKTNPNEARGLNDKIGVIIGADINKKPDEAKMCRGGVKGLMDEAEEVNRSRMEHVQKVIQNTVNSIMCVENTTEKQEEAKQLIRILCLAASHHSSKGYPSNNDLEDMISGYSGSYTSHASTGGEISTILQSIDIVDSMSGGRSYAPKPKPIRAVKSELKTVYLTRKNGKKRYGTLIEKILKYWNKVREENDKKD